MINSEFDAAIDALAKGVCPVIVAIRAQPHLVPPDPVGGSGLWMAIMQVVLQSPALRPAVQALREDAVIGPLVVAGSGYADTMFGSGSALGAEVLPLELVQAACIELLVRGGEVTPDALARVAVYNVGKLRRGLEGDEIEGWCLIAFGALSMQPDVPVRTPWGELLHADRLTAEIWQHSPGSCTAVLAVPVPMKLEPFTQDRAPVGTFHAEAYRIAQLVSYGIALGSDREDPTTAVPLMTGGLLPWGMPGWGGEVRTVGSRSRSTPLTAIEASESAQWMTSLDEVPADRIEVALRRLVRGLAERMDAADQLIDAVIAWENLVEHRDQPTGSVIWGIRELAGHCGWSKNQIQKVYDTRSDVVHGEQPDYARILDYAPKALRLGLDAVREVIGKRPDTLAMTSEERVIALGYPTQRQAGR